MLPIYHETNGDRLPARSPNGNKVIFEFKLTKVKINNKKDL